MPTIDEQLQTNPYLDQNIGDLSGAVPPAGQYTTGIDYQTLHAALTAQYVTEVIHKYEAQLGASPELYQAALTAGYLTPEQAQALQSPGFTQTGTLEKKFASQGGLRTLAGPYTAERAQLLEQALADMQAASEKASSDAYTLATQTTGLRINALSAAGQLGLGKLNAGVSRQNSQDALSAAEAASADRPPLQLPTPPTPPTPSRAPWWEGVLAGLAPAAAAGAIRYLTQDQKTSPEDQARNQYRYEQERQQLTAQQNAPERPPGYGEVQPTQSPFGVMPAGYGRMDTSAFDMPYSQVGAPAVNFNPYGGSDVGQSYAWQQPMQPSYQPTYQMPSTPDYSYNQAPQYDYSGGGGGYDYGSGGYDYPGGYGGDPGYYDYNSHDSGSYYPDYTDYGSYGY